MQLDPLQTPPRSINLATPDFLVMNGTVRGGRSLHINIRPGRCQKNMWVLAMLPA
jgi:hypothetical protein